MNKTDKYRQHTLMKGLINTIFSLVGCFIKTVTAKDGKKTDIQIAFIMEIKQILVLF